MEDLRYISVKHCPFNPLSPKSDKQQISPSDINAL